MGEEQSTSLTDRADPARLPPSQTVRQIHPSSSSSSSSSAGPRRGAEPGPPVDLSCRQRVRIRKPMFFDLELILRRFLFASNMRCPLVSWRSSDRGLCSILLGFGSEPGSRLGWRWSEKGKHRNKVFFAEKKEKEEAEKQGHTMTIVDFIELSDDNIIDLSSDEETVQENQIATQDRVTMLDKRGMFVLVGEGSQDLQAVFVAASEGSQDVQATFGAATEGTQEAAESGHALEATTSSLVMEKKPFVAASEGRQDMQAVVVAAREGRQDAAESGNALEATRLSFVTEKTPLDTAESLNFCPRSPTTTPFHSPTSTTLKAQTSEGGDAKSVRVKRKYRKRNYHTDTPRRSHRLIQMGECCTSPVEDPADDHKRSCTIETAEESAASTDKAGPAKPLSTDIAN